MAFSPITSIAMGVCAIFSGGLWAVQPDWLPDFGDAVPDAPAVVETKCEGLLDCAQSTWEGWTSKERVCFFLKVLALLTPVIFVLKFFFVNPPVTVGTLKVQVLTGKGLKHAAGPKGSQCRASFAKEVKETKRVEGADLVWNAGTSEDECWVFHNVDIKDKSMKKLKIEVAGDSPTGEYAELDVVALVRWLHGDSEFKKETLPLKENGKPTSGEIEVRASFVGSEGKAGSEQGSAPQ